MKRLRHPIRAIREPFGTAGLIVAMVALVVALGGTALAASKLNSTQKKEVEKIAKKYAGKPGTNGAAGAEGKQGPAGAAGKDGTPGTNGTNGTNGSPGAPGKSVAIEAIDAGLGECNEQGGAFVKVEGSSQKTEVCNGEQGEPGPEGQPWTPDNTLPAGAQETGTWLVQGLGAESGPVYASISFPIPLPFRPEAGTTAHYQDEANFTDFDEGGTEKLGCTGNRNIPLAPPGHLCVYRAGEVENAEFDGIQSPGGSPELPAAGGRIEFTINAAGALGGGVFAAKAPCGAGEQIVEVPEDPGVSLAEFICEKSA